MPKPKETEADLSIRFKYGIHTVFMLVSPLSTFKDITSELLEVLNERYPDGLSSGTSALQHKDTPIPKDAIVSYGVLQNRRDGKSATDWRDLKAEDEDTAVGKGLRDDKNGVDVAFVVRSADEADDPPEFVVAWPSLDDDEEEGL